jgi:hypothetical protein
MSLGKLLATGRSLVGGAPNAGRYNLSPRNRLPRFGGPRNPFAPVPTAENVSATAPAQGKVSDSSTAQTAARVETVRPATTAPRPQQAEKSVPPSRTGFSPFTASADRRAPANTALSEPTVRAPRLGVKARLGGAGILARQWAGRIRAGIRQMAARAVGRFRRPKPSFFPRFGRPVVQAELSLDDVKVVRNDLTESDLEFVEPTTSTVTTPGPKTPVASPKRGPVPPALKKLTDRILGPVAH